MPKFAQFDGTQVAITPVIGWFDTDEFEYPRLPGVGNLYECTDAEWAGRMTGAWGINPTAATKSLLPYTPPPPTLAQAQTTQQAALSASCAAAIVAGFTSSALGGTYTYPSQPADQTNLIGAVTSGVATVDFWCQDASGNWAMVPHTAAQIKQVLTDGVAARLALSAKLAGLATQVAAATTPAAAQAITW